MKLLAPTRSKSARVVFMKRSIKDHSIIIYPNIVRMDELVKLPTRIARVPKRILKMQNGIPIVIERKNGD
jgi:hypothetical protein